MILELLDERATMDRKTIPVSSTEYMDYLDWLFPGDVASQSRLDTQVTTNLTYKGKKLRIV